MTMHVFSRRHAFLIAAASAALFATSSWAQTPPRVNLSTSAGDIVIELDPDKAPKTVDNFLKYVKDGHYNGTIFHRVIDGFMIQGGGYTADMRQKPTRAPVPLEASNGLKNKKYTVAMARTGDPNSATSQFFINVKDNAMLDAPKPDGWGYTVFGKVVAGTEVVDKIRTAATGSKGGMQDVPVEPIVIRSATLAK
ncbi:MAG: peptidyl-prolyl cis-trans isomerase [Gammaproteobacteria bacterium]|nr:peptidyl-prolyl cis-trans isomerase [Gammaproteobacteria bacterium]MBU1441172.1 peptidyl-prolyl cis-trans isomerase [Gammaproteobacteria bacterium]MBU2287861.1 peptidyl-prolyl cis-trans isomerase [Gammaproteobacteria bacterium]